MKCETEPEQSECGRWETYVNALSRFSENHEFAPEIVNTIEELSELMVELVNMLDGTDDDRVRAIRFNANNILGMCKTYKDPVLLPPGDWKLDHLLSEMMDCSIMIDIVGRFVGHDALGDELHMYKVERMVHRMDKETGDLLDFC